MHRLRRKRVVEKITTITEIECVPYFLPASGYSVIIAIRIKSWAFESTDSHTLLEISHERPLKLRGTNLCTPDLQLENLTGVSLEDNGLDITLRFLKGTVITLQPVFDDPVQICKIIKKIYLGLSTDDNQLLSPDVSGYQERILVERQRLELPAGTPSASTATEVAQCRRLRRVKHQLVDEGSVHSNVPTGFQSTAASASQPGYFPSTDGPPSKKLKRCDRVEVGSKKRRKGNLEAEHQLADGNLTNGTQSVGQMNAIETVLAEVPSHRIPSKKGAQEDGDVITRSGRRVRKFSNNIKACLGICPKIIKK